MQRLPSRQDTVARVRNSRTILDEAEHENAEQSRNNRNNKQLMEGGGGFSQPVQQSIGNKRTENCSRLVQRLVNSEGLSTNVPGGKFGEPCITGRTAEAFAHALNDAKETQGDDGTGKEKYDLCHG